MSYRDILASEHLLTRFPPMHSWTSHSEKRGLTILFCFFHSLLSLPSFPESFCQHNNMDKTDRFAEHHHLNANHGHQPLQHHNTPLHHHNHHHHLPNPQLYHHPPHPGSEVMAGQYSNRSPTSFSSLLTPIHAMKHHPLQSNGSTNTSSSPTSLHTLQPTHHHPLSQYSAHMHGSPHQFLYHPQHHMRRSLTDDSSYDRPKIWSLAHVATDRLDG